MHGGSKMNLRVTRGDRFEYKDLDTGKQYFSVSQCLKTLDPHAFDGVDPYVLAAAQERGKDLHILFALSVLSTAGFCAEPEPPSGLIGRYYQGIVKFVKERKPAPRQVETSSCNDKLKLAGTLDFNGWLDGKPEEWIIDLKSGPARPVHSAQLQAYKRLQGFEKAKRLGSLYITKNGEYSLVEHTHDHVAWAGIQAALAVLNWRQMQ